MRHEGVPAERIHVTGIPIMPAFAHAPGRLECAQAFGLDPRRTTILLMGGGAGLGSLETVAARLLACADLVITKPGGLTTSECLALGRPRAALDVLTQVLAQNSGRLP